MASTRSFAFYLSAPEMRAFWIFLPFLVFVAGIVARYLPPVLAFVTSGLLCGGAFVLFLSSARTARFNFETESQKKELEGITALLDDALVSYDEDSRILFFSPAAEKLFSLSSDEVAGTIITPKDVEDPRRRVLTQVLFPTLAPTMTSRSESGHFPQIADLSFDDPVLELRVLTSLVTTETPRRFLKIIKNRTQETLLIKSKNEFITVASHQLHTPINEVVWGLEALRGDETIPAGAKELVERSFASAQKLLTLVEDLLNVSKMEEGKFGYSFVSVDIVDLLGRLASAAVPEAERAGVKFYFDRPKEGLPPALVDEKKFSMVITNLLDNAIRYNTEQGEIILGVKKSEEGPFLEIRVSDTGIGIPPEDINKMFSKFFRAGNALKFATEGSGLGLYIARNIVKAHGGRMWAESELKRGTTFFFTLPTDPSLVPTAESALE